ncbi:MAG TPA: lipopolysaccharide assembly protein LapA domain-containing protein [Anaerolineales bacterium]|nr:lipopolysaccharide assembly protein LapA domain-containing protein [Anaerolineales bacterium]
MIVSLILTLAAVILAVMLAMENTTMIQVTFFGYAVQGAAGLFLLIALGVGVVLGVLLTLPALIGRSWTVMQSKRKIAQLENKPSRKKTSK